MADRTIMNAKDAVSASLAECFVTIGDNRYNFMQAINLEANIAYYFLHELHLTPSAFYALPRRERAFIIAAIDVRVEAEKKKQKEIERKQRRGRYH